MSSNLAGINIALVSSSLSCGGAERAVMLIAEGLLKKGCQVNVVTLFGTETDFYKLPNEVNRLALNVADKSPTIIHGLWNNIHRLQVLRAKICSLQPDLVMSFQSTTNVLTLLALSQTNYPVIVNEQNSISDLKSKLWNQLRRMTYPYAAKVVSVSQGVDFDFDWIPKTKRAVVYNPLTPIKKDEPFTVSLPQGADPNKKWAIAMGRLSYQKGYDLLLSAFRKIADQHPDWQLLICGEGELRPELEELRDNLGLTEQVIFPGVVSNAFAVYKRAQLFVMASRWEGLPAVLFEAMACGLPVIYTDCPHGPREIIHDGVDGVLIPNEDVSAFATAMDRLMSDENERDRLAASAPKGAERFSLAKVIEMWQSLIWEVVKKPEYNN